MCCKNGRRAWNVLEQKCFPSFGADFGWRSGEYRNEAKGEAEFTQGNSNTEAHYENICEEIDHASGLAIGPNYPSFWLSRCANLRQEFPSSSLSLTILPTVKDLGRVSYVLEQALSLQ